MYQLNNQEQWDTDFFHTLMSEKRIISSKEAKEIRQRLSDAGALPVLDNNFDWAMLCIGYCFAKKLTENPEKLIPAQALQEGRKSRLSKPVFKITRGFGLYYSAKLCLS